jgi:hypothetical protein
VVYDGEIPLHSAVEWTDERLAQMWDVLTTPHRVELLIDLRLHEEFLMRLAYRVAAIALADADRAQECSEIMSKLEQERAHPGSVDLLNLRYELPIVRGWPVFKETAWALDPMHRLSGAPIGDRHHAVEMMWSIVARALNESRKALPPESATEEIVRSMGPPTLEQILAAAEAWGRPVGR